MILRKCRPYKTGPRPLAVKEARELVALFSSYRRFTVQFAKIAQPSCALMGGKSENNITRYWRQAEKSVFQQLKEILTQVQVLKNADYTKSFVVETYVSSDGLKAVLSPDYYGSHYYPEPYGSGELKRSERNMHNYSSKESEAPSIEVSRK